MQYSPKLKTAMEKIKQILADADIAALIVLHTPGHSEYLYRIDTSYSCAKIEGDRLRIKTNPADNKNRKQMSVADTYNMFTHFSDMGGNLALNSAKALEMLDKVVDADNTDGEHTSHNQQNN